MRDANIVTDAICSVLSPAKLTVTEIHPRMMGYRIYFGINPSLPQALTLPVCGNPFCQSIPEIRNLIAMKRHQPKETF